MTPAQPPRPTGQRPAGARPATMALGARETLALVVFFLSGAAGLLYEVCWIRRASLVFGSTIHALSTVLAVFFLGLAVGSAVFGRLSVRARRPLRVYAWLELGLAAIALLSGPAFALAEQAYGHFYRLAGGGGAPLLAVRVLLVVPVLLPPTLLMGGTLPLFCRQFVRARGAIAAPVGLLYATNTLGAAVGCALAGAALIPGIGVRATIGLGAALNVICAAVAWRLSLAAPLEAAAAEGETAAEGPQPRPGRARRAARASRRDEPAAALEGTGLKVVALLVFVVGLVALGYEVLWTRFLGLVIRSTALTYTLMLTTTLVGIVLGSLLTAWLGDRLQARARLLGALLAASGISVLVVLMLRPAAWAALRGEFGVLGLLLLPSAVLSGAVFPLAVRMVVSQPALAGLGVGRVTAINTAGGIAGSLLTGFVLLPALGLHASSVVLTGVSVAAGCAAWLVLDRGAPWAWRAAASAAAIAAWGLVPQASGVRLPADHLAVGRELLAVREGLQSNLAVVRADGTKTLEIDRLWQGRDTRTQQALAGHLPMLLHPRPRRVLVVGIGAGQTPAAMTLYDLERLDCVDIEPAVFGLIRDQFDHGWLDDPRVRAIYEDGRNFVAHSGESYDVISLELGQPFRPGVGAFYTAEFYRLARARLRPGGLVSQLVPLSSLPLEPLRDMIATFIEVFPQATLWYNTTELVLIGTRMDRFEIPVARLRLLVENRRVRDDLSYSYWGGPSTWLNRPPVLLASFLSGPRGLGALARGASLYRDDRPALEYATRDVATGEGHAREALPLLERHLEDVAGILGPGFPPESLRDVADIRRGNFAQIVASAMLRNFAASFRRGGHAAVAALAESALRVSPGNAYAHRIMGDVLADQGRDGEAMAHYEEAIRLRPDFAPARRELGMCLRRQGRFAEAATHLRECVPNYPTDARLRAELGLSLHALGDYRAAVAELEQAARLQPGSAEIREALERARSLLRRTGGP